MFMDQRSIFCLVVAFEGVKNDFSLLCGSLWIESEGLCPVTGSLCWLCLKASYVLLAELIRLCSNNPYPMDASAPLALIAWRDPLQADDPRRGSGGQ